jgi:protein phosphatase PTC7
LIDAVADNRHVGSSTCVIASLDKIKPQMVTANLGDSGYMILRKNGLDLMNIFQTKEQQH